MYIYIYIITYDIHEYMYDQQMYITHICIYIYHITPIPTDIWGSGTNGSDIFSGPITGHMATMVSGLAPLEVRARSEVRAPVVTPS